MSAVPSPRPFSEPSPFARWLAAVVVVVYAVVAILPLAWIGATAFKSQADAIAYPPKIFFKPTLEGFVDLFTVQTHQSHEFIAKLPPPQTWYEKIARDRDMVIAGPSRVVERFLNSLIIGFGSTILATVLGTLAAYGFSRFKVPLADDLMFFILSTRMMPPIAVAVPIYMMYRALDLYDTRIGMILLYTAVNVSLAVWLLKGFIDEIPREYEEAALIDGYTRLQAFRKVVLPQAVTGIAATAIFCLIFSWNEYAFDLLLAGVTGHDLFGGPVHVAGEQHGAAETLRPQLLERLVVDFKGQMPAVVSQFQSVVEHLANERVQQPAMDLVPNALFGKTGVWFGQFRRQPAQFLRHFGERGGSAVELLAGKASRVFEDTKILFAMNEQFLRRHPDAGLGTAAGR